MRWRTSFGVMIPFLVISVLLLMLGAGATWYFQQLQRDSSRAVRSYVSSMQAAQDFEIGLREIRTHLERFLIKGDRKFLLTVPKVKEETDAALEEAGRAAGTEREKELVTRIREGYGHFFEQFDKLTQSQPAETLYWDVQDANDRILTEEVLKPAHEYLEINEAQLKAASQANEDQVGWLMTASLILGGSGALAGLLLGGGMVWTLRRSIFRIDVQLRDTAGMLSEVAGPVTVKHAQDLRDVPAALQRLAEPIRHLVERIHQSRREALRSEQLAMVGQMAAGIAHEVRNPLMAIKLLVQAGVDRGRGGRLDGRDLQILEEEISRLEGLITTFLDFARPPQPEKAPVDVVHVLEHVRHLVSSPAQLRGVEVRVDATVDLPVIEADRGQLHQLFFNLLLNAVDASPVDGRVWVSARRGDADDGGPASLVVRVRDEGGGLPGDLGAQIFEPFVSTKETGLGLGLSICRRIAQMHRGTITAEDAPDGGAVFTVTLPAMQSAPVEVAQGS